MKKLLELVKKRETLLSLIILVLVIVISILSPSFLSYENLSNLLKSYTVMGIFSLGVLLVIVSGGFDVSFTAIAQVTEYLTVWLLLRHIQGNLFVAFVIAVVVGTLLGLFNGFLIDHYKMPAIIITISTQNLFYGIMYVITRGRLLYTVPEYFWPLSDTKLFPAVAPNGATYGLSMATILWFAMSVVMALLLKYTMRGRSVYLVGGNATAARRIGINIRNTTLFVYGLSGAITGIAAIVHVSIVQTVIPNSIVGSEMSVIAAVVLGGASITGGKGSVFGTFLGVLLFAIISNSLTLLHISSYWYNVFTGIIIIASIIANAMQELNQAKRKIRVRVAE